MKARSIINLLIGFAALGITPLTKTSAAMAEPSSIFRPILSRIQAQLPAGMVMRLPASIELVGYDGRRIPLYAAMFPHGRDGEVGISLNSEPNCQANSCTMGYIAAYQPNSSGLQHFIERLNDDQDADRVVGRAPITLRDGVRGTYVSTYPLAANSVPEGFVYWQQNGITFVVSLPVVSPNLAQDRQRVLDAAISMANESPITSSRSR